MNVTVVIPTYNERDNLQLLVPDVLSRGDYRVLVVDDDSPDGTGEVADALAARGEGVRRYRDRHDRSRVLHCRVWRWGQAAAERGKRRCPAPTADLPKTLGTRFTSG